MTITKMGLFFMAFFQNPQVPTVSVQQAYDLMKTDSNVVFLDVRTMAEWRGELGHVHNAILLPVQELAARLDELDRYKGKTILAICRSGNRSRSATILLNQNGFKAFNVAGGMLDWNKKKLPVVKEDR
jgi:rhodanese-related sulfurtransferase